MGCTPPPVRLVDTGVAATTDDYDNVLKHWTRSAETYHYLEGRLFAHATYLSWAFRRTQIAHRKSRERLTLMDEERLRDQHRVRNGEAHEFFVAAFTNDWRWNTLEDASANGLWAIRLLNERGESLAPIGIERVKDNDPRYNELYPYFGPFQVGYVIRFARQMTDGRTLIAQRGGSFTLRIAGPKGALDLRWVVAE